MATHLTAAERGKIEILLQENFSISEIARKLKRHKSTISREIKKRNCPNGYFAHFAHIDYKTKRKKSRRKKKLDSSILRSLLIDKLIVGWTPEQIAGRLIMETGISVCHETIYSFIYTDEYFRRNKFFQYLKLGRRKRRKWNGRSKKRSKIPNRISIHKRPTIVAKRKEMGHFEADSVLYAHKQAINTLVDLKSGLAVFTKLDRRTASLTASAMSNAMKVYGGKTITADNGSEFTKHEEVTKQTGVKVYFADPYSSWQRGANENLNSLLRAYLPKRSSIEKLSQRELDEIQEEINNRPRKRLNWKTPNEIYYNKNDKLIQFYRCI